MKKFLKIMKFLGLGLILGSATDLYFEYCVSREMNGYLLILLALGLLTGWITYLIYTVKSLIKHFKLN
jgi:hypothetical protein